MSKYGNAYANVMKKKKKTEPKTNAYASDKEKNTGGILGGVGYTAGKLGLGLGGVGEGLVDIVSAGGDLLRGDTEMAEYRFKDNVTGDAARKLDDWYNPGGVMRFAGDTASGIGQSSVFLLDALVPGLGTGLFFAGTAGQNISSAAEKTGKVGLREIGYGAATAGLEAAVGKVIGGGAQAVQQIGGSIVKSTGKTAAKKAATTVGKNAFTSIGKEIGKAALGEGAEEFISAYADTGLQIFFGIDPNASTSIEEAGYAALVGAFSGGLMTAGPAAFNYNRSVKTGRAVKAAGEEDILLQRAKNAAAGAARAEKRFADEMIRGGDKFNGEDNVFKRAVSWNKATFGNNRRTRQESKQAKAIRETLERNIQGYESLAPEIRDSEAGDAYLGEMLGNVYLLENAFRVDIAEELIATADDEMKQAFVDEINQAAAETGQKRTDYTIEDLDNDVDGIRRGYASRAIYQALLDGVYGAATESGADAVENVTIDEALQEKEDGWENPGESEDDAIIYGVAHSLGLTEIETAMLMDTYKKGVAMEPEAFARAFAEGVTFGKYNIDPIHIREDSLLARMNPFDRQKALEAGRISAAEEAISREEKAETKKAPERAPDKKKKKTFVTLELGKGKRARSLNEKQYAAYKAAEVIGEVLGTDIVLHETLGGADAGKINGYYDTADNTIHIALDAGKDPQGTALFTLSHEVTHYIREWSPKKYEALSDFVGERMGADMEGLMTRKAELLRKMPQFKDKTVTELNDAAHEEVIADAMETILSDGEVIADLASYDKSLWEKIKDWIVKAIEAIKKAYAELSPNSQAAKVLKDTVDDMSEIQRLWAEGVREAGERTRKAEAGVIVDNKTGTAMFSVEDIPKSKQEIDDAVNRLVKKLGVDEARARKWVEDEISLATLILRDDMVDYAHRKADRRLTAIVKNSDYKQGTLDFSNICRKRREYTHMMQRIQQAFPNRRFTAEEFATIRQIMVDEGLEVACGLCYVEDRRQNEGYIAETFQRAVEAWRQGNRDTYYDTKNNEEKAYNKGQAKAMAMLAKGDYVPTIADLTTVEGMNKLQAEHKDILQAWKAFNNARGMSSARLLTNEAEYQRQILKYNKARVKAINDLGGLRVFSFSDFEEFHLIDIIQAVQDCAAMGIKIQFYTKVPSFALLMKDTKAKGNLSLIPKGDLGYVMKDGKPVLAYDPVEGIDFNDPAFKKVARGNPNIGTILVGINDTQIRAAMADDFIDYIIPFHTGQTEVVRQIKKIGKWQNYKNEQVDKPWESGNKAKPVNIYTDVIAAAEREGNPIRNERQFVERFLKVCEERGLRPRFSRFLSTNAEGKYVYTKGYYKLLLDFKMFDKDGTYLPQEPVIPEFDADLLHALTEKYVAGEKAKTEAESPAFQRALERVKAEVVGDDKGRMYSIDEDSDTAYLAAVESGDMETAQKMVDEAATTKKPWDIEPINQITSEEMFRYLVEEFEENGYNGRPIVALDGQAMTGSHRIWAARSAYIDIPVVELSIDESNPLYEELLSASDDYQRVKVAKKLYDEGAITRIAYDLIAREDELNDENWERAPKDTIRYSLGEETEISDVSENEELTDREILGMALEGAVQSEEEYAIVKEYREQASMLDLVEEKRKGYSKEAAALERQIKALRERIETEGDPSGFIRKAMDEAIAKKRNAEAMRDEQTKILDEATSNLLRLRAAKSLREVIDRDRRRDTAAERSAAKKVEVAERKAERAKENADRRIQRERERMERLAGESKERGAITIRKRAVMRVLGALETKLYHPTKTNHVPKALYDLAIKTLAAADPDAFSKNRANIKEMGELSAAIEKLERKADRTAKEQERLDDMKYKYEQFEAETLPLRKQAEAILTAFIEYNDLAPEDLKIPKGLLNIMSNRVDEIEDAPLSKMGLRSLEAVEAFVKFLSQQVRSQNELFAQKRGEQVSDWGDASNRETLESKTVPVLSPKAGELKAAQGVREFLWKNMKPLTAFEAIGSTTFTKLFQAVLDGEDVWITDVLEAREAIVKAKEKYGYDKWDHTKRFEFKTKEGKTARLTIGELMSLYAYAQREQAKGHLLGGGFKLSPRATEITEKNKVRLERALNQSETFRMTEEDFVTVAKMLTEDQKKYAETLQAYLTSLGEKGNEVSRKLYGIDAFTEEHYFPIKVISEVLASQTAKTGDPKIKNRGAFQETTPDAKETILLQDFMEITSGHVNDMATYHAFVLPVEDLTRVLNYKPSNVKVDEDGNWVEDTDRKDFRSVKEIITAKYGTQAVSYIEQLIRDLNGGARRDMATGIIDKGITAFKRASTMASLSVLVQQPTSLFRAMAYIDHKYFRSLAGLDLKNHKAAWDQVKKYAGVAAIKEMSGYDTGVGLRTAEFLNSPEYKKLGEKAKAFFLPSVYGGDANYRAEIFGKGAAYADEVAWIQMFDACKREQAEKLGKPMDSEEVLTAAGKRFTEVVRRTQVYDSTLTRSEYMRSKDTGMKMATAFMAEPTTVVSMLMDGLIRAQRGDKAFLAKTAGAIAASIIFNALAASLIYAARDDDEEKTFTETYLATLATETAEGFNPLEYLPITRDIMSLMKGYDIERTDMALFADLVKSFETITSDKKTVVEKTTEVAGAVASFFGVPIKNLVRDGRIFTKIAAKSMSGEYTTKRGKYTTKRGIGVALLDEFSTISKLFGADTTNGYQMYKAIMAGDEAHYNRVASRYKTSQAAENALRKALRDNDERIYKAAEMRISGDLEGYEAMVERLVNEGKFDKNTIILAINAEAYDLRNIEKKQATSYLAPEADPEDDEGDATAGLYVNSDLTSAMERGDTGDMRAIIEQMVRDKMDAGKTEKEARASLRSASTAYWKKRYIAAWEKNDAAEMRRIRDALEASGLYGGYNDMIAAVRSWIQNAK